MPRMGNNYDGPWLLNLFNRTGKRKKALADAVFGGNASTVSKILAGDRKVSAVERDRILEFFADGNNGKPLSTELVPVIGVVAAGVWREADAVPVAGSKVIPVLSPRGARSTYALLIEGNSANLAIQDGGYAICIPYWERRQEFREGDLVHVERRKVGGLTENTLKRIRLAAGQVELASESNDPTFQAAIMLDDGAGGDEVKIVGLVVGDYREHEAL